MMDSPQLSKTAKKGSILAVTCYVLAVVLLITAVVSLTACHQNISRQLEQGVPVQGNELAIVSSISPLPPPWCFAARRPARC